MRDDTAPSPPFYLSPAEFRDGGIDIDLPPAPGGSTLLVIVPPVATGDERNGPQLTNYVLRIKLQVADSVAAKPTIGHPIPSLRQHSVSAASVVLKTATRPLPVTKVFRIYNDNHVASDVPASRSCVDSAYAIYEQISDRTKLSVDECVHVIEHLGSLYRTLIDLLSEPTVLDGNGHIIVFLSRTFGETYASTPAAIDRCNVIPQIASCWGQREWGQEEGEIIFSISLDNVPDVESRRSYYVNELFPRILAHETVHLGQLALARKVGVAHIRTVPIFYREGQAELGVFLRPTWRYEKLTDAKAIMVSQGSKATPFVYPYELGALFLWWLHQQAGAGVQRSLMEALLNEGYEDPMDAAVGVREPLALAMMYASVYLDGTVYGQSTMLDFPIEHTRIGKLPMSMVWPGETKVGETGYTGHIAFRIQHHGSVRVSLSSASGGAFVLVAQP
jgi:hypothetical protein